MWRIVLKIKLNFKYCVLAFCVFLFLGYERDAPLGQRGRGDGSDWKHPLRHGSAVPPLPKGRGFGKGEKFMVYRLASSALFAKFLP